MGSLDGIATVRLKLSEFIVARERWMRVILWLGVLAQLAQSRFRAHPR